MPILLLCTFIFVRVLSFLTYQNIFLQGICAAILVGVFGYLCIKNNTYAWFVLLGELLLGGAGHFFELNGLLLRTWFLGIFGLLWLCKKRVWSMPERPLIISLSFLGLIVGGAIIQGFLSHHAPSIIIQDAMLFAFVGLMFPALEWKEITKAPLVILTKIWIAGLWLFSIVTFVWYASGFGVLRDTYYHWFRNSAGGKITDLGYNFFRVVLPEHEFIIPVILVLASLLIAKMAHDQNTNYSDTLKKFWVAMLASLTILVLNFSRIYFAALVLGFLMLFSKSVIKEWSKVTTICALSVCTLFFGLHFAASRGQSIGLELLGLRAAGTHLQNDVSGAIRLAILPDAVRQIKERPWFGSGLGATITYRDPATHEYVTRSQFDWGYLEMLAELGIVGTIVFFIWYFTVLVSVYKIKTPLSRGLFAGGIALLLINITMPILFHGFGILYSVLLITVATRVSAQSLSKPVHTA